MLAAFVISGAIAGLGGAAELLDKTPFRLADGFGSGFGFDGVAIGLDATMLIAGVRAQLAACRG